MADVEVRVLGPLEVAMGGAPVDISSRLERTLLASLALRAGRPVSVSALAADVWTDPPPSWRKSLHVRVSRIRSRFEAAGISSEVLATTGDGYRLDLEADRLDAHRFHRLFEDARRLLHDGRPDEARATLDVALGLWRGDPLPEVAETAGGLAEAARLVELRHLAEEERTDATLAMGHHGEAVADAEHGVADAPLRERRWAQLMVALYRSGRQADALRAYQRARDLLVDQLGLEPGPELRRLEAAIVAHDRSLLLVPAAAAVVGGAQGRQAGGGAGDPALLWADWQRQVPLVGRAREQAVLADVWGRVRDRSLGGVAVVSGPAGVGKTRLVAELATAAADDGAWILAFRCAPEVGLVPMDPDPLSLPVDAPTAGSGPHAAAAAVRYGLAIFDEVMAVAEHRPVLLIFDDLQRAEPFVVEAMRTIADRPVMPLDGSLPVLIVATLREVSELPPGVVELVQVMRNLHVEALLSLAPLSADEACALLAERLDGDDASPDGQGDADELATLAAALGGNPRHLIAAARHLRSARATGRTIDALELRDLVEVGFPAGVVSTTGATPTVALSATDDASPAAADGDLLWAARQRQIALVGRGDPLARVRGAWGRVRDLGQAGVVTITGSAGMGKSRLLAEAAVAAVADGGAAFGVRFSAALGFSALGDQVTLLGVAPPAPSALGAAHAVAQYLTALYERLVDVAGRQPALILFDDAHLASPALVDGLRRLVDRPIPARQALPILVVVAQRPGRRVGDGIDPLVWDLQRLAIRDELDLGPLDPDASLQLLIAALGQDPDPEAIAPLGAIADAAGGNPGHLVALGQHLARSGIVEGGHRPIDVNASLKAVGLPEALRAAVGAGIDDLPSDVVRLLTATSAVGRAFDLSTACVVAGEEEERALDALEAAVAARVIVEEGLGYRFASPLLHLVITSRLSAGRRSRVEARLHRRQASRAPAP